MEAEHYQKTDPDFASLRADVRRMFTQSESREYAVFFRAGDKKSAMQMLIDKIEGDITLKDKEGMSELLEHLKEEIIIADSGTKQDGLSKKPEKVKNSASIPLTPIIFSVADAGEKNAKISGKLYLTEGDIQDLKGKGFYDSATGKYVLPISSLMKIMVEGGRSYDFKVGKDRFTGQASGSSTDPILNVLEEHIRPSGKNKEMARSQGF